MRATREGMRMLVFAGLANLLLTIAVGVLSSAGMAPAKDTPFGMQWALTLAGMLALIAVVAGSTAVVRRARGELDAALRFGLGGVIAALPAVALHVSFQLNRLSRTQHEAWFGKLVGVAGGVRLGFLIAATIVIADSMRRVSPERVQQQRRARSAHPSLLARGRLPRVRTV